jgi:hypothetical protein
VTATGQQIHDLIIEQAARIVQQQEQIDAALALHSGKHWCSKRGLYRSFDTHEKCPTARALGAFA